MWNTARCSRRRTTAPNPNPDPDPNPARDQVLSAPYNYLVGTSTGLADHFGVVNKSYMARCGGMHVFHIRDLTRIAPLWLRFTERVSIRVADWIT